MTVELRKGGIYRAKKPAPAGLYGKVNDRQIVYLSDTSVQYDSPSVPNGRRYPTIPREKFQAWVGADVTGQLPEGDWLSWENYIELKKLNDHNKKSG